MRKWTHAWLAASVLLLVPQAARAQNVDLTGSWTVNFSAVPVVRSGGPVAQSCNFQGTANVNQNGGQLNGALDVGLTSGPVSCPPVMSATLTGNVTGNQVTMGAMMGGGTLGQATFTGVAAIRKAGPSTVNGSFATTSGPFTGTNGTFSAAKAAVVAVPALSGSGLALLALLLLGAATLLLMRKPAPRVP